jgi:hypothetical protein
VLVLAQSIVAFIIGVMQLIDFILLNPVFGVFYPKPSSWTVSSPPSFDTYRLVSFIDSTLLAISGILFAVFFLIDRVTTPRPVAANYGFPPQGPGERHPQDFRPSIH